MRTRQLLFASVISALAALAGYALFLGSKPLTPNVETAIIVLSALAMVAEILAVLLPHGATGSIGFIPYLSLALVAPHWASVAAITVVVIVTQIARRKRMETFLFNVSQQALTLTVAILAYQGLGGESFLTVTANSSFAAITKTMGLPALSAYALSFAMNTVIVSMFIAVSEGQSTLSVWRELKLSSIGVDLLASPIVFLFAWLYAKYGAISAAVIWVPMVGLRESQRANVELERTNQELLELMVKSIEARDPYTSGHSRRVQHYSVTIARALGLGEREISRVSRAALLHDVGKIYEKYGALLSKSDQLSSSEWRIMQEHPVDGAELVGTMTRLRELVGSIRHHHENWDGSGYPDALAGERIPLAARIIRFADTIDAMTTQRPYRGALSEAQVRQEIVRCRGTQFDPSIADRLLGSSLWKALFAGPAHRAPVAPLKVLAGGKRSAMRID